MNATIFPPCNSVALFIHRIISYTILNRTDRAKATWLLTELLELTGIA